MVHTLLLGGLLSAGSALAQAPACRVLTEGDGLQPLPGCSVVDDAPALDAQARDRLPFDADGLAAVHAGGGYHLVRRDGRSLPVLTWDNGPEMPQEGLLRGRVGTRVGYFDLQFRQVIPALFDFAWPFQDGVAEVCNGCRRGAPDGDGHTPMEGGDWFRIDRAGQRVK